jgi:hypothetical protein
VRALLANVGQACVSVQTLRIGELLSHDLSEIKKSDGEVGRCDILVTTSNDQSMR